MDVFGSREFSFVPERDELVEIENKEREGRVGKEERKQAVLRN